MKKRQSAAKRRRALDSLHGRSGNQSRTPQQDYSPPPRREPLWGGATGRPVVRRAVEKPQPVEPQPTAEPSRPQYDGIAWVFREQTINHTYRDPQTYDLFVSTRGVMPEDLSGLIEQIGDPNITATYIDCVDRSFVLLPPGVQPDINDIDIPGERVGDLLGRQYHQSDVTERSQGTDYEGLESSLGCFNRVNFDEYDELSPTSDLGRLMKIVNKRDPRE